MLSHVLRLRNQPILVSPRGRNERRRGDSEGKWIRGAARLAVVLDVYEGGKDLIPGWKLNEHAENALATGGVEGLRTGSGHRVKTIFQGGKRKTLESECDRGERTARSVA
jgi:hypothetical protein